MSDTSSGEIATATIRETTAQIRFGLNQLSARNGHHEFEEMTRALARETVSRNILPATGPVAAGGDQGRDFETFTSFLANQVGNVGLELGISEGDGLAFACTLQADDVTSKILSDVGKIVGDGSAVEYVIYYCEAKLPVGRRHELQKKAREAHDLHVEVFDGQAIAELLTQRHLYWIAQEFLHLPAAALPPAPERPDWYESDLGRWREDDHIPTTPGDLVDLSGCLRYATFHGEAELDLPFWIERISALTRDGLPRAVQQKARYEMAVAQLRGLGDPRPADELVSTYINSALETDDPSELSDASVLLMYCVGACGRGLTDHDEHHLLEWNRGLQAQVLRLLAETELPGRRCVLLETIGWLRSQPDLVAARDAGLAYRLDPEIGRLSLDEIEEMARKGLAQPIHVPVVDLTGAFDAWEEMVRVLARAPLFPVERLGDMFRISAHMLIEDPRFDLIVSTIDARIADFVGGDAAASNARDRAMTFYGHGRLLDALREIHRARMGWFSGETSEGLVLATLMTSQIYRELELPVAAKYSAMAAARLVGDDHKELYARACFKAAEADYHQAAWVSSTLMADHALYAHLLFAEDPHNWERHQHLQFAFFEFSIIRGIARVAGGRYEALVDEILERTGANALLDELLEGLGVEPWWVALSIEQLAERVAEELGQPAFSDGGERRSLAWRALGVTWVVEFDNTYDATVMAERLAAFAQIALAELAPHDPVLLPSRIVFDVAPADGDDVQVMSRSDGDGTRWRVRLPHLVGNDPDAFRKVGQETLAVVMSAVTDVSVLPQEELSEILDLVFAAGLLDKLGFGTVYDIAYRDLVSRERFDEVRREEVPPIGASIPPTPPESGDLMPNGYGRHYDPATSTELAAGRYTNISGTLTATLPVLSAHEPFLEVVRNLRTDGWKDWHVLLAVLHVAQNQRMPLRRPPASEAEARELFKKFTAPEPPDDPAPLGLFTEEALREAIRFSWASTLKVWGLELHQNPPDIHALESLLATRYGYWSDDSPHDDLLREE